MHERLAPAGPRPAPGIGNNVHQENTMSDQQKAAQGSAAAAKNALTFSQMTLSQKAIHLLKVVGFLCTMGFAFPNVFEDF